jgi:tryptophan 2,3-dioxygenase
MNYHAYLQLDGLLSLQKLESDRLGKPAHDEMLFVIVHQVYELWFKQILTEVQAVLNDFSQDRVDERRMDLIVARLQRVIEIQKILIDQIRIMETMTPLDFLEFRDMLIPASGFQSMQFRLLEIKLGLRRSERLRYNHQDYDQSLLAPQRQVVVDAESAPSLFDRVEKWLERTPFLKMKGFDFWHAYQQAVERALDSELKIIHGNLRLGEQDRARNEGIVHESLQSFRALFDAGQYEQARLKGEWRLSYAAIHAALLMQLYRDQPALQLPFRFLTSLQDMDEWLTTWRYRHALMAKRMLGSRVGTGGSSGFEYLRQATDQHRVFKDLTQLTTFFVPRSKLPELPQDVQRQLGFFYRPDQMS